MTHYDADTLDRMYNNGARVPEFATHLARWSTLSMQARTDLVGHLDLAYGDAEQEVLDIFPAKGIGAPVMVFIHGGYWRSLDKAQQSFLAPAFAATGTCVVLPNYALCPNVTLPQIVIQMAKALIWVYRNINRFGGNPDRVTVMGHSAGGHLAAMASRCLWQQLAPDLPAKLVKSALSISGLYELESVMHAPYLQKSLHLDPRQVLLCSPAWMPPPDVKRGRGVLCTVAGGDESEMFMQQQALIRHAWGRKAVPVSEVLPDLNHFSILETLVQPGQRLHALAQNLLHA